MSTVQERPVERNRPLIHAHDHDGTAADGRRVPTPSTGWTGTVVRLVFGVIWAIDAYLKWQPGYRDSYISTLKQTAQGQPSFLDGWFHFWIQLQPAPRPSLRP